MFLDLIKQVWWMFALVAVFGALAVYSLLKLIPYVAHAIKTA
jgi:hypothetical protein